MIARRVSLPLLTLTALLAACSKPAVESYRVPKEPVVQVPAAPAASAPAAAAKSAPNASAAPAGASMASTPVATASGADLTWTAPASWKNKPASSMRKGSFAVTGDGGETEVAITAFPGDVGGELANYNRWRGQIQLPPAAQAEYEAGRQLLERNGLKMIVVDIGGPGNAQRILGAMIPVGGSTWFVKMGPGPDALVTKEKATFLAFLDTVKPAAK